MRRKLIAVDVTPRDGLQNEKTPVDTAKKLEMIGYSSEAGFREVEVTAMVHPKLVPQMADAVDLLKALPENPNIFRWVLVPNKKGLERLLSADAKTDGIAFFSAASETFSRKNSNCTLQESIDRFKDMLPLLNEQHWKARVYISTALGCPFEGNIKSESVAELASVFFKLSGAEICIADTIGTGTPAKVKHLIDQCLKFIPAEKLSVHFHDTYGQGLINTLTAIDAGVDKFDVSVAGAGGCPFAPGASGNLSAEKMIYGLDPKRFDCSMHMLGLIEYATVVARLIGKQSPFTGLSRDFF